MDHKELTCVDMSLDDNDVIEIELMRTPNGRPVLYVNVNGFCRLRVVGSSPHETFKVQDKQ